MVLRNFEQQHIFSYIALIAALQYPNQIPQYLFKVTQKSYYMLWQTYFKV